MKKFIALLVAAVVLLAGMMTAFAQINISIDGELVKIPADMGQVVAKDNRTFVPVRFILENFGYQVEFLKEDNQIMGTDGKGNLFMMQIGSPYLFFKSVDKTDTTKVTMDVTPYVDYEMGRVYVPARFLVEEIGYGVDYDGNTKTVLITSK